ncbi:MAG: hypothetical protein U0797_11895 [Gemmataceae bacterium]
MTRHKTWILTDAHGDVWLDSFSASNDSLPSPTKPRTTGHSASAPSAAGCAAAST